MSRDGPDTRIYVIHYKKSKISEQVSLWKSNFDIRDLQQNIYQDQERSLKVLYTSEPAVYKIANCHFFFFLFSSAHSWLPWPFSLIQA